MTTAQMTPSAPMAYDGTRTLTPFPYDPAGVDVDQLDRRMTIDVTADDANRFLEARGSDTWVVVTDQLNGDRWAVRDWPCGFDCDCAAVARRANTEVTPNAALRTGDVITEIDTPDGPYYEVARKDTGSVTVRSHGEEVTLPAQAGACVLRLKA